MIELKELLKRKGLESLRRKHERDNGLKYTYEIYDIENKIMKDEYADKFFTKVNLLKLYSDMKKQGNVFKCSFKKFKSGIKEHLDAGGYTYRFRGILLYIVVKEGCTREESRGKNLKVLNSTFIKDERNNILLFIITFAIFYGTKMLEWSILYKYICPLVMLIAVIEFIVEIFLYVFRASLYKQFK